MISDVKQVTGLRIREMTPDDIEAVMDIETMSYDNPLNERQLKKYLRRRNMAGFVSVLSDEIIGFILIEIFKSHFHLIDVAVHSDHIRQGVGKQLMAFVTGRLSSSKKTSLSVHVRETNLAAQLYLKACGLKAVTVIRNFYQDTGEDCYKMEYRLRWPRMKNHRKI